MGERLLEARGVHVTFPSRRGVVRAVDGVDLDVGPGEVLALVGESGCGKTTLIRSFLGLDALSSGSVTIGGERLTSRPAVVRRLRRRTQMVFQDPSGALDPRHTVYEAVAEGIRIHRLAGRDAGTDEAALVTAALDRVGLRPAERYLGRFPHELSGGQRQRVVIAGALALGPRLLLADEPVASLDASIRGEILALMRSLVDDDGLSIVAVTHDLGLAWNIADRIAVMYLGRIVEQGVTEEILSGPRHPYTRALLSVVPEHEALEQQILVGEAPDPTMVPAGCRFHSRCPLVASGEAGRRGLLERCLGSDPVLTPVGVDGHSVACHAAADPEA
jgi:oligopeptide/dipeptide ABC transporter ATP-binding protein